jgi:hypothetical protein
MLPKSRSTASACRTSFSKASPPILRWYTPILSIHKAFSASCIYYRRQTAEPIITFAISLVLISHKAVFELRAQHSGAMLCWPGGIECAIFHMRCR